jgi:hypothetical protein
MHLKLSLLTQSSGIKLAFSGTLLMIPLHNSMSKDKI